MTEYTIKIVNCETGEEIIRDMTPEEIEQRKADEQAFLKAKQDAESELVAKQKEKAAIAAKLGLTVDQLVKLLG